MASLETLLRAHGKAYRIRYRLDGKACSEYLPINTPALNAKALLLEFDRRLALHKIGQPFVSPLRDRGAPVSLREFKAWFLENKKTAIRRGRAVHKGTLYLYGFAFDRLIEAVGDVRAALSGPQVKVFEGFLGRYEPGSRSIIVRSLRAAWAMGIEEGVLVENPFRRIPVSKDRKTPIILTNDEKDRIYAKLTIPEARLGFALARYAGLRRVEICRNVRWQDVDFESGILTIPEGKSGQQQQVPLLAPLEAVLRASWQPSGYIVSMHQANLTRAIERAREAAGVHKPGAVRILRHSLGAGLMAQGVDIRTIQLLLRHSDISTTTIYTKIPAGAVKKLIEDKAV